MATVEDERDLKTTAAGDLRLQIRRWLDRELPPDRRICLGMSGGHNADFSRRLGEAGWLGLSVPAAYGGRNGTALQRFIVTEELLAAQAPVGAHWLADRQVAPSILRIGTEEQRRTFLPHIVRGECYFSIGLSEPEAGSDLSSVRTQARRVAHGWRVSGTKIWTTFAQHNHYLLTLCRTQPRGENRHSGLSQLIISLKSEGVQVRPIRTMDGSEEFCEVILDDVFVPEHRLLGCEGQGWAQAAAELALERYGPERWLSVWGCLTGIVDRVGGDRIDGAVLADIGRLMAKYRTVRRVSMDVARSIDRGLTPTVQSAVAKDLATALEQETVEVLRRLWGSELTPSSSDSRESLLARAVLISPTFTIRGGTTEVLRGLISREESAMTAGHSAIAAAVAQLFARSTNSAESTADGDGQWQAFVAAGFPWATVPQERGGPGGAVRDAVDIVREVGRAAAAVPAGETDLLGDWLLEAANLPAVPDLLAVAPGNASDDLRLHRDGGSVTLSGTANRVAWASRSGRFVAIVREADTDDVVREADTDYVVCVPVDRLTIIPGESLAGEPRDAVIAAAVPLAGDEVGVAPHLDIVELRARGAAIRAVQIQGAVEAVVELVVAHCAARKQFGRRLQDFQAVAHQLALMREYATVVSAAADLARSALEGSGSWEDAAAAKIVAGEAAGQIAKTAHQLHGAIGVSDEYVLHRYTRRLWAWRDEYGGECEWAGRLGVRLVDRGPGALWPWLTAADDEAAI